MKYISIAFFFSVQYKLIRVATCSGEYQNAFLQAMQANKIELTSLKGNQMADELARRYSFLKEMPAGVNFYENLGQKAFVAPLLQSAVHADAMKEKLNQAFKSKAAVLGIGSAENHRIIVLLFESKLLKKIEASLSQKLNTTKAMSTRAILYAVKIDRTGTLPEIEEQWESLGVRLILKKGESAGKMSIGELEDYIVDKLSDEEILDACMNPNFFTKICSKTEDVAFGLDLWKTGEDIFVAVVTDYFIQTRYFMSTRKPKLSKFPDVTGDPGVKAAQNSGHMNIYMENILLSVLNEIRKTCVDSKNASQAQQTDKTAKKQSLRFIPLRLTDDEQLIALADKQAIEEFNKKQGAVLVFQEIFEGNDKVEFTNIGCMSSTFQLPKVADDQDKGYQEMMLKSTFKKLLEKSKGLDLSDTAYTTASVSVYTPEKTGLGALAIILSKPGYRK